MNRCQGQTVKRLSKCMTGMLQTNSYMACSCKAAEFIHKCWILIILFEINYPQKKIIIKLQFDTNYFSKTNPTEVWWEYLVAKSQLSCKITVTAFKHDVNFLENQFHFTSFTTTSGPW